MQAEYSNYDSDSFKQGSLIKFGGLNPKQEFRPQAQKIEGGSGLLISVKSDTLGTIYMDFTNIIEEPYTFSDPYVLDPITDTYIDSTGNLYYIKSLIISIKASNFRIRFRNTTDLKQETFKLFTYILTTNPLVTLNPDTLPFIFDISGSLITSSDKSKLNDGLGNIINSTLSTSTSDPTIRSINSRNINNYLAEIITFDNSGSEIVSQIFELNEYKNFDVVFQLIDAHNYAPIRFYLYISDNIYYFTKTDYYIDIYNGDTTRALTNITVNASYARVIGNKISGLSITTCFILKKG